MVLNPYFTQGTTGEQNLVQDLINEQLKIYGVDIFYLPRKYLTTNTVIREVVQSKFDVAYPLEAYVDNYDEFSGGPNLLTKFGIQSQDEVRLIISRERFETYISPLIENQDDADSPQYSYRSRYPNEYVSELKVIKFEKDYHTQTNDIKMTTGARSYEARRGSGTSLEYTFIRAFPRSITSMPVSYDGSSLLKCSVQMNYMRYLN